MNAKTKEFNNKFNQVKEKARTALREKGIAFSRSALQFFEKLGEEPAPAEDPQAQA